MHIDQRHLVLHLEVLGQLELVQQNLDGLLLPARVVVNILLLVVDVDDVLPLLGAQQLALLELLYQSIDSLNRFIHIGHYLVLADLKLRHDVKELVLGPDAVPDLPRLLDCVQDFLLITQDVVGLGQTNIGLHHCIVELAVLNKLYGQALLKVVCLLLG